MDDFGRKTRGLKATGITDPLTLFWESDLMVCHVGPPYLNDIAEVTGRTKLWVKIKLKNGKSLMFISFNENGAEMEPPIEAIAEAMSGRQGPLPLLVITPPKRNFAPIPPPQAPVDAPAAPVSIVVGQTPEQVKAALGQPDRIDLPPSLFKAGNQVICSYKSLTVTFVDGKVAVVKQENLP